LQTAQRFKAQEAILTDHEGNWLESSTGTLWGWKDDAWWTPPLTDGILPGLLRSYLLKSLSNAIEKTWTPDLVREFSAIAYTNCVMEVIPIHTVLDREIKHHYTTHSPGLQLLREGFTF
ncbi:MAG: aminotransferase class IV, partial [Leptolyngbya sp. Prado105]|nr:aminotransferase class IV [Leptolyngbya sp. Prado105]